MAMDFPATPAVGDLYPDPPIVDVPQYRWDGFVWRAIAPPEGLVYVRRAGDVMTGALGLPGNAVTALQAVPKQQLDAVAASALDAMAYSGMQINGSFDVDQEQKGAITASGHITDGWRFSKGGTFVAGVAVANSPGYFVGLPRLVYSDVTTQQPSLGSADQSIIIQYIEGYRIARLAWGTSSAKPITIAFWSSHKPAGIYSVWIFNSTGARAYVTSYTHAVADVPQYNVITIPGDTVGPWNITNAIGLQLGFTQAAGSNYIAPTANVWGSTIYFAAPGQVNGVATVGNVVRITGVTVLPGIYAPTAAQSPLIMRPYDQELLTCQRYYETMDRNGPQMTIFADADSGPSGFVSATTSFYFKVTKRAVPSIGAFGTITQTNNSGSINSAAATNNATLFQNPAGPNLRHLFYNAANSGFFFDARL